MKQKNGLRATSTLLLTCLCLQAIPAQCADIFFNYTTANRLYVDLKYTKQSAADKEKRLQLCDQDRKLIEKQVGLLEQKATGLQADKDAYRAESDRFKTLYIKADQDRIDAENAAPSRFRWFAAGFFTALAAGIAAAFAAR